MSRRLRIAHVAVQPVLVWDDGADLSPGPQASPITIPVSALDGLRVRLLAEVEALAEQMPEVDDHSG